MYFIIFLSTIKQCHVQRGVSLYNNEKYTDEQKKNHIKIVKFIKKIFLLCYCGNAYEKFTQGSRNNNKFNFPLCIDGHFHCANLISFFYFKHLLSF